MHQKSLGISFNADPGSRSHSPTVDPFLPALRKSLLYAIGAPIEPGDNINTTHDAVVSAVQTLYDTYKGFYGWEDRALQID